MWWCGAGSVDASRPHVRDRLHDVYRDEGRSVHGKGALCTAYNPCRVFFYHVNMVKERTPRRRRQRVVRTPGLSIICAAVHVMRCGHDQMAQLCRGGDGRRGRGRLLEFRERGQRRAITVDTAQAEEDELRRARRS